MSNDFSNEEEDAFEAMLAGDFEETPDEVEEEEEPNEADEVEADDTEEVEDDEIEEEDSDSDNEDTDLEEDEEEEDEPDDDLDGDDDEESETEADDEEENTLVETDDEGDEDSDEDETDTEDGTDTEAEPDGADAETTDEIDYRAFYEAVTGTEFIVNGKTTKGFTDPKKLIAAQQMAGGFSDKMASFKKYRPYMAPLKERGMLDDPDKFNLAMQLVDGNVEALKAHMKSLKVDPLELDMDEISYDSTNTLATQESIILDDTLEVARNVGIEPQLREVIGNEWDQASFDEFLVNPEVRSDLMEHIRTGAYNDVKAKIAEKKQLDVTGQYGTLSTIAQYREAVKELQVEYASTNAIQAQTQQIQAQKAEQAESASKVEAEKAKIAKERKEAKYKDKANAESKKLNDRRKKATSASRRKPKAKAKAKFDPLKVEGEELDELMDFLISGDR